MDLSTLSLIELRNLLESIPAELSRRETEEKANFLNKIRAEAKVLGISIDDVLVKDVKPKSPATGNKVKVKYRHPQDAALEWTGRGRKPKWVEAWLASGASLDNLLV